MTQLAFKCNQQFALTYNFALHFVQNSAKQKREAKADDLVLPFRDCTRPRPQNALILQTYWPCFVNVTDASTEKSLRSWRMQQNALKSGRAHRRFP